jgi:hypothetical protein
MPKTTILQRLQQLRYDSRDSMKKTAAILASALLCGTGACSSDEPAEPPVATPSLTLNKTRAAIASPLQLTYRFEVLPNAAIDGDYTVFVHVLEPGGEKLWQDDHQPAIPTSQWKPGQTVEYSRTVFVPNYPYLGDAEIRLGLYNPSGKRLPLNGREMSRREYVVGNLHLLPQSENIFLVYKDWHPSEVDASDPAIEWQWSKGASTLSFRNPKRESTLYLEWDARIDLFNPPQQVAIKVNGQPLTSFAADSKDKVLRTFPISAEQLGPGDMAEITIEVDRTFKPGGSDTRELGIRVYHAFIEPK